MNINFDCEPVYGDNAKIKINTKKIKINTKIKIRDCNVNTNFQGKILPKENASCKCLSLIMLDSVLKVKKKYHPQILLEECKYEIKKD